MKVRADGARLRGVDLTVTDDQPVARFSAFVHGTVMQPRGDMRLTLVVPYPQVPHVMPLLQQVGGVQFEVTVRRVPGDELPEPGW